MHSSRLPVCLGFVNPKAEQISVDSILYSLFEYTNNYSRQLITLNRNHEDITLWTKDTY